jgi:hypothetical protein
MANRYREIHRAVEATKLVLSKRFADADIQGNCIELPPPMFETLMLKCRVESVRGIAPGIVGQKQLWSGPPVDRGMLPQAIPALAILVAPDPAARLYQLAGWVGAEQADIRDPLYVEGDGKAFLTIPITSQGSSTPSADIVLARTQPTEAWAEIDASTWMRDLEQRLPRGLYPKLAYSLDLLTMRGLTSIGRDTDPNCCPTGGEAEVGLPLKDVVRLLRPFRRNGGSRGAGSAHEGLEGLGFRNRCRRCYPAAGPTG